MADTVPYALIVNVWPSTMLNQGFARCTAIRSGRDVVCTGHVEDSLSHSDNAALTGKIGLPREWRGEDKRCQFDSSEPMNPRPNQMAIASWLIGYGLEGYPNKKHDLIIGSRR